jgi:hypothetical protein
MGAGASGLLTLVGVVIGGLLTLAWQLLLDLIGRRRVKRELDDEARVVARIQQDAFWSFEVLASMPPTLNSPTCRTGRTGDCPE